MYQYLHEPLQISLKLNEYIAMTYLCLSTKSSFYVQYLFICIAYFANNMLILMSLWIQCQACGTCPSLFRGRPCDFSHSSVYLWLRLDQTNSQYCDIPDANLHQLHRKLFLFVARHQCTTQGRLHCHFMEPCGYVEWRFRRKSQECHVTMVVQADWNDASGKSLCGKWACTV